MVIEPPIVSETEVFGVTYERYALQRLSARLTRRLGLRRILELPASGAKAMPSLYSLGFALAGCEVALGDAHLEALSHWEDLGLAQRLTLLDSDSIPEKIPAHERWDLVWNFAVLPCTPAPEEMIKRLAGYSRKWLLFVNVNRFNVGFAAHRAVHRFWKIPWTHGDVHFFSPFYLCDLLRSMDFKKVRWGVVDCPTWPDSLGFRDLRLHRLGETPKNWISPYVEYLRTGSFPAWMKWVYLWERLPLPNFIKLPYAHLFYVLAELG